MHRLVIRRGLWVAQALAVLGLCLFADCTPLKNRHVLAPAFGEVVAILRDPGVRWMLFVCAGIYFFAFVLLRRPLAGALTTGTRWNAFLPGDLWLAGLVGVVALASAFDYAQAVGPTQALTLLGAAVLGQGAGLWEGRRQKAEGRNGGGETVLALIILLVGSAVWQAETERLFQYRGLPRWSGPWDNPNTFGILMGVGMVLPLGLLVQSPQSKVQNQLSAEREGAAGGEQPTSEWGVWVGRVLLLAAAGVVGVGLLKSYSRGAWVGAVVGVAYLLLNAEGRRKKAERGKAESRKQKAETGEPKAGIGSARNWAAVAVVCGSVAVLGFWSFGRTERAVARRAYSVGNANDFSWRNRVAAWEGGLQMMAEKPWFGFGWNQPERIYSAFYRAAKVDEGMAFQLNDYFMLGATLGLPALLCFAVYIVLAISGRQKTAFPEPPTLDSRRAAAPSQRVGHWTLDSSAVCRAGAAVLLVGFWFHGGLFKLATAAPFWILLELGRARDYVVHEAHENE